MMRQVWIKRIAIRVSCVAAGVVLISACASTGPAQSGQSEVVAVPPRAELRALERGSTIAVLGAQPGAETADVEVTEGDSVGRATAAGAGAGALYGAGAGAAAGLACGPLFLICSPVMAVAGLAGGAIGGAILGGTVLREEGSSVPPEQVEALDGVLTGLIDDLEISRPLVDQFKTRVDDRWAISSTTNAPQVVLKIEQLYVDEGTSDLLVVKVVSSMTVYYGLTDSEVTRRMLFPYASSQHEAEYWTANDGAELRAEIQRAFERQATDMISVLEAGEPAAMLRPAHAL